MIEVRHLKKQFQQNILFSDFNLSIPQTGILGITGPSGCGKTTFARILLGLEKATAGEINLMQPVKFSAVFPEHRLIPSLTAVENVGFVSSKTAEILKLFRLLELEEVLDYYPSQLSSGMKRRVAFIRGFVFNGDVLVLDEPFNGLDWRMREKVVALLEDYSQRKAVVLIDHDISLLNKICREVKRMGGDGDVF